MTLVLSTKQQPWPVPCPAASACSLGTSCQQQLPKQLMAFAGQHCFAIRLFSLSLGGEGDAIWPSFVQCSLESKERFQHPGPAGGMLGSQAKFLPVLAPGKGCN